MTTQIVIPTVLNGLYIALWAFLGPTLLNRVKAEDVGWPVAILCFLLAGVHLVVFTFLAKAPEGASTLGDYLVDAVSHNARYFSLVIVLNFLFVIASVIIMQKTGFQPAVALTWELSIMACFFVGAAIWFGNLKFSPWLVGCLGAFVLTSVCMFMHQKTTSVTQTSPKETVPVQTP